MRVLFALALLGLPLGSAPGASTAPGQVTASAALSPLEKVAVIALAPVEGRAVVKRPEGELEVVRVGDSLPGTTAVVLEILDDRLVVDEELEDLSTTRRAWIFKVKKPGARSRVMVLERQMPPPALDEPRLLTEEPPPIGELI